MYRLDNWDDLKADPTCQLTTNFFLFYLKSLIPRLKPTTCHS